jgi:hypothetical protein
MDPEPTPIIIRRGREDDRLRIFRKRHEVFATELGQHPENEAGELSSPLDECNDYVVAEQGDALIGFVSLTPPGHPHYAIERYWPRDTLPFQLDKSVIEIRLLVIDREWRRSRLSYVLCWAAWRSAYALGVRHIVCTGHDWTTKFYMSVGFERVGQPAQAGAMSFELLIADMERMRGVLPMVLPVIRQALVANNARWALELPFELEP